MQTFLGGWNRNVESIQPQDWLQGGVGVAVYVEDWGMSYGSPYLVKPDDSGSAAVELVEDGSELRAHDPISSGVSDSFAFVDGVRRGEAALYHTGGDGNIVRGVAGALGCGSVIARSGCRLEFFETRLRRYVIWNSGHNGELPDVRGGWRWASASVASDAPEAPLNELQARMRQEEGRLAEDVCKSGHFVVVDGPLNFALRRDLDIVGYIKTHHRALLPPDQHREVAKLRAGQRTSLFRLGDDRYSAYLRLVDTRASSGPWSGIVRLEFPSSRGLASAQEAANKLASVLPRFAGVPHRDARAPQNLQPIGALEIHLRHLLGNAGLAERAVRESIYALNASRKED
jgi:hypothetical protein